jgi:hypothetical protein
MRGGGRGDESSPAEVTAEILAAWFGGETHWMPETRKGYRSSASASPASSNSPRSDRCDPRNRIALGRVSQFGGPHAGVDDGAGQ